MVKFRNIVTAFLTNNDNILLMKRGSGNPIAPGYWYGVGGHMEPEEINDPYGAIYREIKEECSIDLENIDNFELKYIVYNRNDDEVVVNHFFFGEVKTPEVVENNEGSLHWVPREEVLEKTFHPAIKKVLEHSIKNNRSEILIGVMECDEPYIWWYPI